jgi:hypothetical protein
MAQLFWLALGLLASSVADAATANYTFTVFISYLLSVHSS